MGVRGPPPRVLVTLGALVLVLVVSPAASVAGGAGLPAGVGAIEDRLGVDAGGPRDAAAPRADAPPTRMVGGGSVVGAPGAGDGATVAAAGGPAGARVGPPAAGPGGDGSAGGAASVVGVSGSAGSAGVAASPGVPGSAGRFGSSNGASLSRFAPTPGSGDAGRVHVRGVTGDGVRVGVVGAGFDPDHRAIAPHVVASRGPTPQFRPDAVRHGTAVAEVVTDTAPGADLYLASVGASPTPAEYEAAVGWLVANDVDVVVDAGSYFPRTERGARRISAAAERATREGVVFVTSAGNYADRHWRGAGARSGWVAFANGTEVNPLSNGSTTDGRVSLRLRWNSTADYDLYLYRHGPGGGRVVAKSTRRQSAGAAPVEAVDVGVPRGRYYVAVYARNGTSPSDRLRLFAARHSLGHATAEGSVVAPATADRVIAVSAVDDGGRRYRYSSVGGGRADIDVGGPGRVVTNAAGEFSGTSAAAPYVAGIAALMEARDGDLSPAEVEAVLETTAVGNGSRVDAAAAVRAVERANPAVAGGDTSGDGKRDPSEEEREAGRTDGERREPDPDEDPEPPES